MAKQNYDEALRRLLISEGGYTNNPSDPGGPTNFGITIADYRKYINPASTASDIKAMKVEEAKSIYRARYWDAQSCDNLPSGIDYAVFDYGVNSGIGRSGKVLKRCIGLPDDTSSITPDVITAVRAADPVKLINSICDERLAFLKSLKTWPVFGNGWGRRVSEVRAASLQMAASAKISAAPPPPDIAPINPKPQQPASSGIFSVLISILSAIFKRK